MTLDAGTWTVDARVRLRRGTLALDVALRSADQRIAIVGPSGIGKTTLLRALAGLEPEASGEMTVLGEGIGHLEPWARGVGWMPQDALLFPHLDVLENLVFGGATRDAARAAAEATECDHLLDRRPRNLSGGERQRVALARALVAAERLLLLDEPFSSLDDDRRTRILGAVDRWLADRDTPMVLVTHDLRDAKGLRCEEWVLTEKGLVRSPAPAVAPSSHPAAAAAEDDTAP